MAGGDDERRGGGRLAHVDCLGVFFLGGVESLLALLDFPLDLVPP